MSNRHECSICKKRPEMLYKYNGGKFWYEDDYTCESCYEAKYGIKLEMRDMGAKEVEREAEVSKGNQ
jgi:hypothetical protein